MSGDNSEEKRVCGKKKILICVLHTKKNVECLGSVANQYVRQVWQRRRFAITVVQRTITYTVRIRPIPPPAADLYFVNSHRTSVQCAIDLQAPRPLNVSWYALRNHLIRERQTRGACVTSDSLHIARFNGQLSHVQRPRPCMSSLYVLRHGWETELPAVAFNL